MDDRSPSSGSRPAGPAEQAAPLGDLGSARPGDPPAQHGLSPRDAAILDVERRVWRHSGVKEETVRRELGLSAARYYQLLNALIDRPEALLYDPMLIRRLQRIRDARADARRDRAGRTPVPRRASIDD